MLILLLVLSYAAVCLRAGLVSDLLLKYQFQNYYDSWVRDGKPHGMFYAPKGSSTIFAMKASLKKHNELPAWAYDDNEAKSIHAKVVFWEKILKYSTVVYLPLVFVLVFWG
ncbi:hypothetical protein [Saccharophagus degradans]|nr:hypothetical protein [Saccharophagus degradans]